VVIVRVALDDVTVAAPVADTATLNAALVVCTAELTVRVAWVVLPTFALVAIAVPLAYDHA
jgi:hypothetical protein